MIVGQVIGALVTVLCLFTPHFKRKWQMAASAIVANLLSALNFLLLEQVSACAIGVVSVVQAIFSIRHARNDTLPTKAEIWSFGILYIYGGLLPYLVSGTLSEFRFLDMLPMLAALLFLAYLSQKEEQRMRLFLLGNASIYLIYNAIIFSTQFFAQLFTVISVVVAIIRYRKKTN